MNRAQVIRALPPVRGLKEIISPDQDVYDIVGEVINAHYAYRPDYAKIAGHFPAQRLSDLYRDLYDFCKKNVSYKIESAEDQTTRSPGTILKMGNGDCKHYAGMIAGVLDAKGLKDWKYRFASYNLFNDDPGHVFVVAKDERGKDVWIDPVLTGFNIRSPFPYYFSDKKPTMLTRLSGVNGYQFSAGKGVVVAGAGRSIGAATPYQTGTAYFRKVVPIESWYGSFPKYVLGGVAYRLPQNFAIDLPTGTNPPPLPEGLTVTYPANFLGKPVPVEMLRPVVKNGAVYIRSPYADVSEWYTNKAWTSQATNEMLAKDDNRLLKLLTAATGAIVVAYGKDTDGFDIQRMMWRLIDKRHENMIRPTAKRSGIEKFADGFVNTVKAVAPKLAIIDMAGPRLAFITLVKFNVFAMANNLNKSLQDPARKNTLYERWNALGGKFSALENVIAAGIKNKPFISGASVGEAISAAAVAGYVAAASAVIVALGNLIKANNPGDAKTAAMVDGANGLMNGYLAANGYDVVGNAQGNGNKPVAVLDDNGNVISLIQPNSTGFTGWIKSNPLLAVAAGGAVVLLATEGTKKYRRRKTAIRKR